MASKLSVVFAVIAGALLAPGPRAVAATPSPAAGDAGTAAPIHLTAVTRDDGVVVTVRSSIPDARARVRVYRRVVPYLEYTGSNVPVVPDGSPPVAETSPGDDGIAVFTDSDVTAGDILAYWARVDDFQTDVVVVRVRDSRALWSPRQVDESIEMMPRRYAGRVRIRVHGETVDGWPLRSVSAGNPDRMIAFVGGIHPGESGPEFLLPVFEQLVAERRDLLEAVGVAVLPLVAADTRKRLTDGYPTYLRRNANGVDLNRNFDADWERVDDEYGHKTSAPDSPTYRGPFPNSEPETQAVIDFVQDFDPVLLVSMHGPGIMLFSPTAENRDMERKLRQTALMMIAAYEAGDSIPASSNPVSPIPGTLSRWVVQARGIPAYDQENDAGEESVALNNHRLTREGLATFRRRNYRMWCGILEYLAR